MNGITRGDTVRDKATGKLYEVDGVMDVFGITAADLLPLRKDGQVDRRAYSRRDRKNLPISFLEKVD